jgi:phosphoribosylformylglycinamidine synthase
MKAKVFVRLKSSVLDPQGKTVLSGLKSMGFKGLEDVRVGKFLEITFSSKMKDPERARADLREMCEKLLANTVIEEYDFEIEK